MIYTFSFKETKTQNKLVVKNILRYFELAMAIKVNFIKSKIEGVGVKESWIQNFLKMLHCDTI